MSDQNDQTQSNPLIRVTKNGPYLISGNIPLAKQTIITDAEGYSLSWAEGKHYPARAEYALCRCGHSAGKPYCDGTHAEMGFKGTETASREVYLDQAKRLTGPDLILTDVESLCASGRFCDRAGGTWKLTKDSANPLSREIAIQEACECPSGRLVVWDKKTGEKIEPELPVSIGLIEDPRAGVSGPIWARGGIPVEDCDGNRYEIRNRVTLCRCGKSENKPFCDTTHVSIGFSDEE